MSIIRSRDKASFLWLMRQNKSWYSVLVRESSCPSKETSRDFGFKVIFLKNSSSSSCVEPVLGDGVSLPQAFFLRKRLRIRASNSSMAKGLGR